MEKIIREIKPLKSQWETKDPFLFCAHHRDAYPKGNDLLGPDSDLKGHALGNDFGSRDGWNMYHGKRVPGFPVHPHRGFETITMVQEGYIDHTDSAGAAGRYGNGDVQWMTAGKGLQHAEMFPLLDKEKPNTLELFQIWLNLPKSKKLVEPYFKMLWKESIPRITHTDADGKETVVTIVTGNILGHSVPPPTTDSWAHDPANEVAIVQMKMSPGAVFTLQAASKRVNRMLFFYRGEMIHLGDQIVNAYHSIELEPDVDVTITNKGSEAELLLLQGKPLDETVVQYGPFVMNSQLEIQQTIAEFRRTEFGGWPWPKEDHVHTRERGRFATYQDGSTDEPVS